MQQWHQQIYIRNVFFVVDQIQSGQLEPLHCLLSSYYFLYANVRHGLVHHLLETYSLYSECV